MKSKAFCQVLAISVLECLQSNVVLSTLSVCPNQDQCPNFGDDQDDTHCCPSTVKQGDYYCCDYDEFLRQKYSLQNDLRNAPKIVGIAFALLLVLIITVLLSCFFCNCCYLYKFRQRRLEAHRCNSTSTTQSHPTSHTIFPANSRTNHGGGLFPAACGGGQVYHPISTDPKSYDAPPPYPIAQHYPAYPPTTGLLQGYNHIANNGLASQTQPSSEAGTSPSLNKVA